MKIKEFDTIASIATSLQESAVGIIKISGEEAFNIINKIFVPHNKNIKNVSEFNSHTINYGKIVDEKNNIIDEVLVSIMKAPKTYTCENIVEINCHGGIISLKKVLELVIQNGARLAEPGEFTKRAFLNGRIDLSQAEAVIDIINAKTDLAHKAAIKNLDGKLTKQIKNYRNEILTMIANIEVSIDYPEHSDETMTYKTITKNSKEILSKIETLIKNSDTGKIIKNGIKTVILGKPNVGKSSILNVLLQEERAIVSETAGTTRDVLQESLNLNGIFLNIIDTAGIRNTKDNIEKIGVEKSKTYAKDADLIFLVLDSSKKLDEDDIKILDLIKNKKVIVLINKIDLKSNLELDILKKYIKEENFIKISAKEEIGFENLKTNIENLFFDGKININEEILISNERNKISLIQAKKSLLNVLETIENNLPEDLICIDLVQAYNYLGEITGESLEEDIINKIFSEFCLGK